MNRPGRRFRTRFEAHGMAKRFWVCQQCHIRRQEKPRACDQCGSEDFWYFPSIREANRAAHLLLLRRLGEITDLEFTVPFEYHENGIKCFTYYADSVYTDRQSGERVVEDVKGTTNPKGLDPVFRLKKKLIEARYGLIIQLVKGG